MFELVLRAPQALVERVGDALSEDLGALAVSVEDADAGTEDERALFGEPGEPQPDEAWIRSTLRALFSDEGAATAAAVELRSRVWSRSLELVALQAVPDADWVRLTQAQFGPMAITSSFWVVPSWHEPPAQAERCIRLDPGLAFGTGSHATTRMCLRWIARHVQGQTHRRVLDYGCGSGILAIAAAMHGALEVDAVDIDPAAVEATWDNARHNGVALRSGGPGTERGRYDLVVANILAAPLKLLAPLLLRAVAPGGRLLLAGLLQSQAEDIAQAYAPAARLEVADTEEGWALLAGSLS